MATQGIQFRTFTADTVVSEGPCEFWGILVTGAHLGSDVTIYNGRDTTSGKKFHKFECADDLTISFLLSKPVQLYGGCFADVREDVKLVTVLWEESD